jgi:hypothetical protein
VRVRVSSSKRSAERLGCQDLILCSYFIDLPQLQCVPIAMLLVDDPRSPTRFTYHFGRLSLRFAYDSSAF